MNKNSIDEQLPVAKKEIIDNDSQHKNSEDEKTDWMTNLFIYIYVYRL